LNPSGVVLFMELAPIKGDLCQISSNPSFGVAREGKTRVFAGGI